VDLLYNRSTQIEQVEFGFYAADVDECMCHWPDACPADALGLGGGTVRRDVVKNLFIAIGRASAAGLHSNAVVSDVLINDDVSMSSVQTVAIALRYPHIRNAADTS